MNRICSLSILFLVCACSRNTEKGNTTAKSSKSSQHQAEMRAKPEFDFDEKQFATNAEEQSPHRSFGITYPKTAKLKHIAHYFDTPVEDNYHWLEDNNNPTVRQWTTSQNATALGYLAQLPNAIQIRNDVSKLLSSSNYSLWRLQSRANGLFALKTMPPKQQPFLVHIGDVTKPKKSQTLVDPNTWDPSGNTTIDWFEVSPNGKYVAVSLSKFGSEIGDLHIFSTSGGIPTGEVIPRVSGGTAGGSLAWAGDSKGFYYTRYPRIAERPTKDLDFYVQVYFHTLGDTSNNDRYEIGKDFPHIAEIQLELQNTSGELLATVQKGDGGIFSVYHRGKSGIWNQISKFGDRIVQATFGRPGEIYLVSRKNAPRGKLLRIKSNQLDLQLAKTLIPESEQTIVSTMFGPPTILATSNRLYLSYQLGGPTEIRVFDHEGNIKSGIQSQAISHSSHLIATGKGDEMLFHRESYLEAGTWLRFDGESKTTDTKLSPPSSLDLSKYEVVREFATSMDGTQVPVNIIRAKNLKLDASHPCLVTAYGGYGVSLTPHFSKKRSILLDQGFVYAIANIRGGGEFGEQWHQDGYLDKKQNVFDDFSSVIQHLHERKYSSPEKTAIIGGSNGGLLMAATMTQHPDQVSAVISSVGIYDMLRFERSSNGAFNVTEFGTVKNPEQFKALYAYSPYHHVIDNTEYPAALFLTGSNDPRVDSMHSRKMVARLQAANSGLNPILLRSEHNTGHGNSTPLDLQIEKISHILSFMFYQLGHNYDPSKMNPLVSLKK